VERPLLILDLDETVVWASEREPSDGYDFRAFHYFVRKRPHLESFLATVGQWYELGVWSSSGDDYAHHVVEHGLGGISRFSFVWARSRCTERIDEETREPYFAKDLKKVRRKGYSLARTLIIDDSPEKVRRHFGNHLRLTPFEGQSGDRELLDVLPFLEWLKKCENFRAVEKRHWKRAT
jgi:RNA polymerase II subunit A small phosphatase-like protein